MKPWFQKTQHKKKKHDYAARRVVLLSFMLGSMAMLVGKAVHLQVVDTQFLQQQAKIRHIHKVKVLAYRGNIVDSQGEPLAVSTPMVSVTANPQECHPKLFDKSRIGKALKKKCAKFDEATVSYMAALLKLPYTSLRKKLDPNSGRHFVYLKRHIRPDHAQKIKTLKLPGIDFEREFKRFYPAGEVTAHLLGFTNIDDIGQEGLELHYQDYLQGTPGSKRVIRDGEGRIIEDLENIRQPVPGQDLQLSIDRRLQYLAYRELKKAVDKHQATAGSLVMLDAKTGNVLATVNQPSFNPHVRSTLKGNRYRNRAMVDVFEPGSTVKPFVVAAALEGGYISEHIKISTHGYFRVGRRVVRDIHNYGQMDLTRLLKKSSNVGVSKVALTMPREYFWDYYQRLGFGEYVGIGFPRESSGTLLDKRRIGKFEQSTLSFGYGLSCSLLQLARAYTALADDGVLHSVSLLPREQDLDAKQIMKPETARKIRTMLEQVVKKDGTAYQARVDGYRVAGKTGTVKKATRGGYTEKSYLSVFVGMAPASDPQIVMAVMVDEPKVGGYYGGAVAGPVFSKVMAGSLRALDITPDEEQNVPLLLVSKN